MLVIDLVCESYREAAEGKREVEFVPRSYCQLDAGGYNGRFMRASAVSAYVETLRRLDETKPGTLLQVAKIFEQDSAKARLLADEIEKMDFGRHSSWEELAEGIRKFGDAFKMLCCRAYHYIMLNRFYPDLLSVAIAERVKELHEQARIASVLFSCAKPTGIRLEKKELVKLASDIQTRMGAGFA